MIQCRQLRSRTFGGEYFGDGGGERGLAMVHVSDGADVHVRLVALEHLLASSGRRRSGPEDRCARERAHAAAAH